MPSIEKEPKWPESQGRTYWRSLRELAASSEYRQYVERAFPPHAAEKLDGPSRREFLRVIAASLALAGATGCRWPKETIVPYGKRPDNRIPGVPAHFATAMELGGVASGLLVTSYDGRPIKIEGNPSHPINQGAASAIEQASVLELYDPDRSRRPSQRDKDQTTDRSWDEFATYAKERMTAWRAQKGKGVYVLSEASSSPSLSDMRQCWLEALPETKWLEYEPVSNDNEREGTRLATGTPLLAHPKLDRAEIILSLEADPLGRHPAALKLARDFIVGRNPDGESVNRLYAVESYYTTTGAMADHRLIMPSGSIELFALYICAELFHKQNLEIPENLQPIKVALEPFLDHKIYPKYIPIIAKELTSHKGRSVILAGPQQSEIVHALVYLMNWLLDSIGKTITYTEAPDPKRATHLDAIRSLKEDMNAGIVQALIILGGNPAYDSPVDLNLPGELANLEHTIHLSLYENETSQRCRWRLPRAHFLESWGDARAYDGTICAIQPLIAPLYEGKSAIELLSSMLEEKPQSGYEIVRRVMKIQMGEANFEARWQTFLHDGILSDSRYNEITPDVTSAALLDVIANTSNEPIPFGKDKLELVFVPDSKIYDGRFSNNGWLQELPDYHTKLTWDNAAMISPALAEELSVRNGEMILLRYEDRRELEIAAYIMPGQAQYSIMLPLGYGRTAAGRAGNGVGFNTYQLRTTSAMNCRTGLYIEPLGYAYPLAMTQDHHFIDLVGMRERERRIGELIREADLDEYKKNPDFLHQEEAHHTVHPLWKEQEYPNHKWGMAIDLNSCIGCNACVAACQAENNIPVVGKKQVKNGREMHWIRIDRYFKGDANEPEIAHQPVACVQCENAPCEQVCPVAATTHDHEGLNAMVYNRCIGTRYCSNNCPYKVRRFNFFNYQKDLQDMEKMQYNPDVTVRSRGVMEKCTYCTQRIEAVKIAAKNDGRAIADGEIIPACAQTCPTKAIVFGDLNNKQSRAAQLHAKSRSYFMLGELNIKPRTAYLAKIRNPNPELAVEEDV
ncbi:MAG: TAT-variant-translocated molybdopterin oxidoreductase [Candidatus Omnitrophota bacterium]